MTSKRREKRRALHLSEARLAEMIEEATVDAHGQSEQVTGWLTMIDEYLELPFETTVLGIPVTVERVDLNRSEQIVAICRRGRERQALPILDVPLPTPPPEGAEWIEAARQEVRRMRFPEAPRSARIALPGCGRSRRRGTRACRAETVESVLEPPRTKRRSAETETREVAPVRRALPQESRWAGRHDATV